MRAVVKMPCLVANETHGWHPAVDKVRSGVDVLLLELASKGIDLGREFTVVVDHAGQVLIATQDEPS